jgi:biotin carboxylase
MADGIEHILCLASQDNGHDFLRQCAGMGVRPTLLTLDNLRGAAWPREVLQELAVMPAGLSREQILNTVSWMARGRRFDRVVALDTSDLDIVAQIREHLRVPGMGITTAAYYRDKLAMRICAHQAGFAVPEFCRVLNYDELRAFMERVPPPWLLQPRCGVAGLTRQIDAPEHLWRALDDLGDQQSRHMLQQILPGEFFAVDAILSEGEVLFSVVQRYGRAPWQALLDGGVQTARVIPRDSPEWLELTALNAGLAPALGMVRGVTHAEFVRSPLDGGFLFTEIAAPVSAAWTSEVVEAATGVNLWREWARLEVASLRGQHYLPPDPFEMYAGSVLCQGQDSAPDLNGLDAAEIVQRAVLGRQTALLIRSADAERLRQLIEETSAELARRTSSLPPAVV